MTPMTTGTMTFLFTDIEGSTLLLARLGDGAYEAVLEDHHRIIRSSLQAFGGAEQGTEGDSFFAVFAAPSACVAAALQMQRELRAHHWPAGEELRIRMGIHTGEASEASTGIVGYEVHRAARIAAVGYGGQVLVSSSTVALVQDSLPPGASVLDLGSHRLKDLRRPEVIFQLKADGLDEQFPPLRSLDNPALLNNLPQFVSSFVGRDTETAEVRKLVSDNRLVTLSGAGGAGKTRLAVQVAADLLDGTGDGVWLVELASVTDPAGVPSTVANALGVTERSNQDTTETLVDVLSGQHRLVVLDNCEHLLDGCAKLVDSIVRHCPGIHVLTTSREPLRIDGEIVYRVPPLSLPPDSAMEQADLANSGAVTLFVERTRSQLPGFVPRGDELAVIASICRRLDGMPLAIELSTARLRSLSLAQLAERLEHRFSLLTGGSRASLPRQQTLRALVDWSYGLLIDPERVLLRRLSVFLGGFELEAAEAVSGLDDLPPTDIVDLIDSLVDKSLVIADGSGGPVRYEMLETLRQYAAERLEAAGSLESDRLLAAHSAYYVDYAERAAAHLRGPSQETWFGRLDQEQPNLRRAIDRLFDTGRPSEVLQLFGVTRRYWWFADHDVWVTKMIDQAFEQGGSDSSAWTRAAVLVCKAHVLQEFDLMAQGRCAQEAIDAARMAGDRALEAEALGLVSYNAVTRGVPDGSPVLATEAITIAREVDDPALLAETLMYGGGSWIDGDFTPTEATFQEGLSVAGRVGDRFMAQALHCNYGNTLLIQGEIAEARDQFEMALDMSARPSSRSAIILSMLGYIQLEEGDVADAESKFVRSLREYSLHGGTRFCAYEILGLALCASCSGDAERGARLHGGADALLDACGAEWELGFEKKLRDRDIATLQVRLGDQFQCFYDAGRSMRNEDILDLALGRPSD